MTRPLLDVRNVTRRFGGLVANSEITFSVAPGEIIGLIGPNGAGKTTLFNVLVGIYPPSSGEVIFDGKPIGGLKPHRIAAAGLTKTFQNVALFAESTVLDNVVTGGLVNRSLSDARAFAVETLERVGIGAIADKKAGDLSFPERARVEVARALCTSPKLLLLDEVMAALTPAEMEEIIDLVRGLRDEGMTFIVVEHHMKAVMKLCERLVVLNFGEMIADGTPEQIASDRKVLDAYLGANFSTEGEGH
ncbi:MAG: ABC transporter ATP-binding protein [Stappia sp.]|uniref:ABC transporter ATP-binding protein n=1 Tax=Stappia sp. TaxID=1870903 RepID=UPI000C35B80D|nr:ABC transporter ATP-binding protein [Stappia sp.]MAB00763.1 ABC transporter ATP-binding protein [Stappia sp.]MBM18833.1 ABC transporter ATP-binding protein [Stappia sp.]